MILRLRTFLDFVAPEGKNYGNLLMIPYMKRDKMIIKNKGYSKNGTYNETHFLPIRFYSDWYDTRI